MDTILHGWYTNDINRHLFFLFIDNKVILYYNNGKPPNTYSPSARVTYLYPKLPNTFNCSDNWHELSNHLLKLPNAIGDNRIAWAHGAIANNIHAKEMIDQDYKNLVTWELYQPINIPSIVNNYLELI